MPAHNYSMLGLWSESVASNTRSRASAQEQAARNWPGAAHPSEPHHLDFMEYALLQMGQEHPAKQIRDDNAGIKKLGFEFLAGYTGLAAVPARFALERQAWKEAAALEPRGSQFPQAEAITYFARAMGSARSGDLAAADREMGRLKELRATLDKASQSYWAEQVEIQMLAASAWVAQTKGAKDEAQKLMRAAADLEDNSEKHIAMENRLYPMRELLGDLLLEQKQPAAALKEYETSFASTPNRLRGLYGAAKAADMAKVQDKAMGYFQKLAALTREADSERPEIGDGALRVGSRSLGECADALRIWKGRKHILPKSDVLLIFMSYSTMEWLILNGTRRSIGLPVSECDRSPHCNDDETLRLTNNFSTQYFCLLLLRSIELRADQKSGLADETRAGR